MPVFFARPRAERKCDSGKTVTETVKKEGEEAIAGAQ